MKEILEKYLRDAYNSGYAQSYYEHEGEDIPAEIIKHGVDEARRFAKDTIYYLLNDIDRENFVETTKKIEDTLDKAVKE